MMIRSKRQVVNVLKYWSTVEFFSPFDLDSELLSSENKAIDIDKDTRELPWLSEKNILDDESYYSYCIYFLPFEKSELTKLSKQKFGSINENEDYYLQDEGSSCFAKLYVDHYGTPSFKNFSISTLPWAMNLLARDHIESLRWDNFCSLQENLKSKVNDLIERISHHENFPNILMLENIHEIIGYLLESLNTTLNYNSLAIITIKKKDRKKQNDDTNTELDTKKTPLDSTSNDPDDYLPILNSFYIKDLEKVISHQNHNHHVTLNAYINGVSQERKIDLYNPINQNILLDKLNPKYMNNGRWPNNKNHSMSLMQQYAINECFNPTNATGVFSVNGPPGTGKTTMYQDIIAENIVRRAAVLSHFNKVEDTFEGKTELRINTKTETMQRTIRNIHHSLTGYEMLVASSNNAAVENISRDLPLVRKLEKDYQKECTYLKSVAYKYVAEINGKKQIIELPDTDKPWGLISATLGNSSNCNKFVSRIFFSNNSDEDKAKRLDNGSYLTLYEWSDKYSGPTFEQAKNHFKHAEEQLATYLNEINTYSELFYCVNDQIYLSQYQKYENYVIEQNDILNKSLETELFINKHISIIQERNELLKIDVRLELANKPHFIHRIFNTKINKTYKTRLNELQKKSLVYSQEYDQYYDQLKDVIKSIGNCRYEILTAETQLNNLKLKKDEYNKLKLRFQDMPVPPVNEIITDDMHKLSFWQNDELNDLRSKLFISALKLHEAWLAEALKSNGLKVNLFAISKILCGCSVDDKSQEILLWQTLFMIVPVISSTFASIARLFKNIDSKQLGWLLIDEAGQAVPQAAIGAMWRAKQTVVVGDPLQIEPVVTISDSLINGLANNIFQINCDKWLPNSTSVQVLADDANILGAYVSVHDSQQWIGSPLRVHRRCSDPMFSIANQIAYSNKMISAKLSKSELTSLESSCWFDVVGAVSNKQYVEEQGYFLRDFLLDVYNKNDCRLDNIFVITPFKAVKSNLINIFLGDNLRKDIAIRESKVKLNMINKWAKHNIGTVHTFQGKESDIVIFILGADQSTISAVKWASSKPNLLNVALTRAKERFYIIGDYNLWSNKPFYLTVAQLIKKSNK